MTLGEIIRDKRREKGFSQRILGERCGSCDSRISHIERGAKISIDELFTLTQALELNILDVLVQAGYIQNDALKNKYSIDICNQPDCLSSVDKDYIQIFTEALIARKMGARENEI